MVVDDAELRRYEEAARARGLTLAAWVRQALRAAGREIETGDAEARLAAVREACSQSFPAPDIDEMLGDIERGYVAVDVP